MQVGRNLYEFLQFAAGHFSDQRFWIDAICINQSNDVEKSVQVQRMGTLFSGGFETWVWLGKDEGIQRLFMWTAKSSNVRHLAKRQLPMNPTPHRDGLERLEHHPYWYRAWVTKEVLLAPRLKFVCGRTAIDVDALSRCAGRRWTLRRSRFDFSKHDRSPRADLSSHLEFRGMSAKWNYDFWTILAHRYNTRCMHPRDRLYSLLAFFTSGNRTFEVDYSEDIVGVFWNFTHHIGAWNNPYRVGLLCEALGLTQSTIERLVPPYGCQVEIPLRLCKPVSGSRKRLLGPLIPGLAAFCDHPVAHGSPFRIKAYKTGDLLLCSGTDINRQDTDAQSLHVLIRRSNRASESPLIPFVCVGSDIDQMPDHRKLRYKDHSGVPMIESVALETIRLREAASETPDTTRTHGIPYIYLELTHGYVLQCYIQRILDRTTSQKHKRFCW